MLLIKLIKDIENYACIGCSVKSLTECTSTAYKGIKDEYLQAINSDILVIWIYRNTSCVTDFNRLE